MYFPMPGLDVPAKETNPAHSALVCCEADDHGVDTANPFFKIPEGQGPVAKVIEDYAFESSSLERGQYVACGNGDALRRFVAHIMIDIDKKKRHLSPFHCL